VSEPEEMAQDQLREIVRDLEATRFRLLGVRGTLPPTPLEIVDLLENEPPDTPADIRTVIQCVLADHLLPAIHDLRAASEPREEKA
jgi:hypothetical protein